MFNGIAAAPTSWSDSNIVAPVPAGSASGSGNIVASVGGVASNGASFTVVPNVASITPTSGTVGALVTIQGTSFGATQGASTVTFNGTAVTLTTWSDTSIIAIVPSGATTGNVTVKVNGFPAVGPTFNVSAPTITTVSPTNGMPGTQVTISGSGFGATQGSGSVWLGTANGTVVSWSDTQVVASVASGSTTGTALIMQGGVPSNDVAFTVNVPAIASLSPTAGASGTAITITGSGFGDSQGSGNVWLGSAYGVVNSWSDTQIVAAVASGAQSGTAKVLQNGVWSNAINFTVPSSGTATTVSLFPNLLSMIVGETRTLQTLNTSSGAALGGLSWTSSDSTIVSLSTDDPPVITAIAPGNATITAGDGTATITVYPGPALPAGSVIWSDGGDGGALPAVPSDEGVADVFAFQDSGIVQAVADDGTIAWAASLGDVDMAIPDFQSGLVLTTTQSISKLDGTTGQANPSFQLDPSTGSISSYQVLVHPDGTVFAVETGYDSNGAVNAIWVIGVDPTKGTQKFAVQLDNSTRTNGLSVLCPLSAIPNLTDTYANSAPPQVLTAPFIAGDGYFYIAYQYSVENCAMNGLAGTDSLNAHLTLLRVGSDGSSSKTDVQHWQSTYSAQYVGYSLVVTESGIGIPVVSAWTITNADAGALVSWAASNTCTQFQCLPLTAFTYGLATVSGGNLTSSTPVNLPGQGALIPMLQAQDGSFIGIASTIAGQQMVDFDAAGNLKWTVPGYYWPQITTSDGGVIATSYTGSTITFDQSGSATGQLATFPVQSWSGSQYPFISTTQVVGQPYDFATSYAAEQGGNPGTWNTYVPTLGAIYRAKVAELAKGYIGDSTDWKEGSPNPPVTCNIFVEAVLQQAADQTSLPIPVPTRPPIIDIGSFPELRPSSLPIGQTPTQMVAVGNR